MPSVKRVKLDEYQYQFHKVMTNDLTRAHFMKHLVQEYNVEPLLFWEDCKALQNTITNDTNQLIEQVDTIYNLYISRGGKRELNISSIVLKKVSDSVNNVVTSGQEAYELFQPAIVSVLDTLEKDTFSRFVRTSTWKAYVKKYYSKDALEMDKVAIHRSQLKQMTYSLSDINRPYINEYDLRFALHMSRDGLLWESIQEKNYTKYKYVKSSMVYKGHLTIFDEEAKEVYPAKFHISKVSFIINNCDAKTLFELIHSKEHYNTAYGTVVTHTNVSHADIGQVPEHESALHSLLLMCHMKVDVPFAKERISYNVSTVVQLGDIYVLLMKQTIRQNIQYTKEEPEPVPKTYSRSVMYCWTIAEAIDDHSCRITTISAMDPGGKLSNNSNNMIIEMSTSYALKSLCKKYTSGFEKALKWYEENNRPPLSDTTLAALELLEKNADIAKRVNLNHLEE
jgi:hypothetical protein